MGNLVVDNSILSATAKCSMQAVLEYVHHYRLAESNLARDAGSAAHLALAHHFRGGGVEDCVSIFEQSYRPICEAAPQVDDRLHWKSCSDVMRQYFIKRPVSAYPFSPIPDMIERGARIENFCEGVDYFALLDLLATHKETQQLVVVDHKTTGRISDWWATQFRLSSQLSGYAWAAEQLYSMPVQQVFINAIEFSKLPDSSRKCRTHGVPYNQCRLEHANFGLKVANRVPAVIEAWKGIAVVLAGKFAKLKDAFADVAMIPFCPQEGAFNGGCTFCDYKDYCQSGRALDLDQMYVKERWAPWEVI